MDVFAGRRLTAALAKILASTLLFVFFAAAVFALLSRSSPELTRHNNDPSQTR